MIRPSTLDAYISAYPLPVEIRPPDESCAEGMNELFKARAEGSAPTHTERGRWRAAWCDEAGRGHAKFLEIIRTAQQDPDHYWTEIALLGGTIVGMLYAEAPETSHVTLCRHVAVAKEIEGHYIGTLL